MTGEIDWERERAEWRAASVRFERQCRIMWAATVLLFIAAYIVVGLR